MVYKFIFAIVAALLMISTAPRAHGEELSPKYLAGRWVIGAKDCSSSESEYVEFRENRTFENTRGGKAEIVGFWEISSKFKGAVEVHMVTSPVFFHDIMPALKEHQDMFYYFQTIVFAFNLGKGSFEALGVLGDQMRRVMMVRCK